MKFLITFVPLLALAAAYEYPPPKSIAKSETEASIKSNTIVTHKFTTALAAKVANAAASHDEVKMKKVAPAKAPYNDVTVKATVADHRSVDTPAIPTASYSNSLLQSGYAAIPSFTYPAPIYQTEYDEPTYQEYSLPSLQGLYALSRLPYNFPITSMESYASPVIQSTYSSAPAVSSSTVALPPVPKPAVHNAVPVSTIGTQYGPNGGYVYNT